VYWPTLCYTCK